MNKLITLIALIFLTSCSSLYRSLKLSPSLLLKEVAFEENAINSEYKFHYPDTINNDYLKRLRMDYHLPAITSIDEDDFAKIKTILNWTNSQWSHSGSNSPSKYDPITILEEAKEGNKFRCVEYGIVLAGALNSIGIPSRVLSLKTSDVEKVRYGAGHVVAESYSRKFEKWIFMDGQYNVLPVLDEIPLNGVEFQKAILENREALRIVNSKGDVSIEEKNQYIDWISKYLYYFDTKFDNRNLPYTERVKIEGKAKLMLVPEKAENPTVFQKKGKIDYCLYTNNVNDFYQKPK